MTELEVKLSADIKALESELKKAEAKLKGFGENVDKQGQKTKKGFDAVGKGAANATPTLQEFSRVIQDAPFGIIGVGNNITQLVSQFGNLQRATGSAGAAFKAVIGSLAGPGGILFAVSAIVTALTLYGDKLQLTSGFTDELSKKTAEFVGQAQNEIEVLRNLVSIASDENQSKKVREGAIQRINEKYGKYLGNLDEESIKTNAVKSSIDALTNSLLKQAQVRGIQALIEEKYKDSAEDLVSLQLEQKAAAKAVEAEVRNLQSSVAAFNNVSKDLPLTDQIKEIQRIVNQSGGSGSGRLRLLSSLIGEFNNAVNATKQFTADFNKELDPLRDILSDATIADLFSEFYDIEEVIVTAKEKVKGKKLLTQEEIDALVGVEEFNLSLEKLAQSINFFDQFDIKPPSDAGIPEGGWEDLFQIEELERVTEELNFIISNGVVQGFAGIGQAIGEALITGENLGSALGKSLLQTMGSVLTQLGELAIQTGVGILAVQTALKSLNPYVAIAAGVALVAIGSAFSSATRSLGSASAGGGGFGSGSVSGQGAQGGRISNGGGNFGASVNNNGTVVFEISGQKLVGVLNRTLNGNSRLGGNLALG